MNRWTFAMAIIFVVSIFLLGCSGSSQNPMTPESNPALTAQTQTVNGTQTHLWGVYDFFIDTETGIAEVVTNRNAMFSANVVNFLNGNPAGVTVANLEIIPEAEYMDILLDVTLRHPLTMSEYNGYDVRGIFIGNGSETLDYGDGLIRTNFDTDQYMLNEDGYTRWFNPSEFTAPGILGYVPGRIATPGYTGTATLNPYKYFADGLDAEGNLMEFLTGPDGDDHGVFSAASVNTRHYEIRFPTIPPGVGVSFNYSVVANWEGETAEFHPSNAAESVALSINVEPDLYYVDAGNNGGSLIMDFNVFGWDCQPSTVWIESDIFGGAIEATGLMAIGGGDNYSTYHVDIPATNLTEQGYTDLWVIPEYSAMDYANDFSPPGTTPEGALAAFFRFDLLISPDPYNLAPEITSGVDGEAAPAPDGVEEYTVTATDPNLDTLYYDWVVTDDTVPANEVLTVSDDLTGALTIDWANDLTSGPVADGEIYYIDCEVSDGSLAVSATTLQVDITLITNKNVPLREVEPYDLAVAHTDGDLLVLYTDGQVWRYTEAGDYQDGALFYTTSTDHWFIDVGLNDYSVVGGNITLGGTSTARAYVPAGSSYSSLDYPTYYEDGLRDVMIFTSTLHQNWAAWGAFDAGPASFRVRRYQPPGFNYNYDWHILYTGAGPTSLLEGSFKALESSNESACTIYCLEGSPEFSVEKYELQASSTTILDTATEWGGSQSDGMTGFNDPLDITRDDSNDYYILDVLSTSQPSVKKYGDDGTAIGSFGDSTSIAHTPMRIEGSEYNGNVFVLHYDGTGGQAYVSIFTPDDMD